MANPNDSRPRARSSKPALAPARQFHYTPTMTTLTEQALQLSRGEQLQLLEDIWENLASDETGSATPAWHREELLRRAEAVERGEATFAPMAEVFERIDRRMERHQRQGGS